MTRSADPPGEATFIRPALEATIRIGLVVLLVAWCFQLVRPFIVPVVWAVIIATAVQPAYSRLVSVLHGRNGLAATLFTLVALVLLFVPTAMFTQTALEGVRAIAGHLEEGTVTIPPAPAELATWPVVGEPIHRFWGLASVNLETALSQVRPQLIALSSWLLSMAAGVGLGLLQFIISIAIAGVLLARGASGARTVQAIATRLAGERGPGFADLASATVRSVAQGVLGVAVIQSVLAGIGLIAVGVPAAGLWALLVLLVAIVQLPPLLILGPIIIYVFSTAGTVTATLFAIWGVLVSMSDTFLKPLLLGRGVEIPMLVILVGAIGGMMSMGIIGLFVGSVVLGLSYELFVAWLRAENLAEEAPPAPGTAGKPTL
jgi:predicted PurR-regulated permease PerM